MNDSCTCSKIGDAVQVLEALALAETPPDVEDSLKPDHEWMLSTANDELESFRVGSIASAVSFLLHTCPHAQVRLKLLA